MSLPSSCSSTITSIAPLSVAGLIEFHVLDTDPLMLRTYCILGRKLTGRRPVDVVTKASCQVVAREIIEWALNGECVKS